jgi:hypothetical protein
MKLKFIKAPLILALIFMVTLSGCLKDSLFDSQQTQAFVGSNTKVISLGLNVQSTNNSISYAYNNSPNDTTVQLVPVELGGSSAASGDVHVTLALDQDLIDSLNNADGSDFAYPPGLTFPSMVVTIPSGSRVGYLSAKFNPGQLIGLDNAVGFKVVSVQESGYTISGNLSTGIVYLLIKNSFDGFYQLVQRTTGWAAYGISDGPTLTWPNNVVFATTGASSNTFLTTQEGNFQPAFTSSGGVTGFGATETNFTFDPTTGKLTSVANLIPDDGRGRAFALNPAITDSRIDLTNNTVYAAYIMSQNGRPPQYFYDTLYYVGPR